VLFRSNKLCRGHNGKENKMCIDPLCTNWAYKGGICRKHIKANNESEANRNVRDYTKKEEQIDETYQYKFWCNMNIGEKIYFFSETFTKGSLEDDKNLRDTIWKNVFHENLTIALVCQVISV